MERKKVGILIFDDVEVLDYCGPYEVFSTTRLVEENRRESQSPFEVILIAEHQAPIVTSGGMRVLPDYSLEDCPQLDILVVPGGWGTRPLLDNPKLLGWLQNTTPTLELLTSVCTGALVLGQAGLLEGKQVTTHWRSLDWMQELFPQTTVLKTQHVVEDGKLLTSAGISAGIDMALTVVSRYCGEPVARATAKHMEYPFPDSNERRIEI
ncbi:DJ-1/PfpI family protein [Photobacterium atrarenae]|uniref:DJ-1/PfpI family protein n=1 Tax=Photobacterium atrarenae TaxID=865757 RepID=A0ABY5GIM9_9GAMM|nr:DJ-1/PfpI family protein [Photobacterium atrarenae]UTV29119.1 DJ-1/PfpI family protein [Photobacterium atrarenae]